MKNKLPVFFVLFLLSMSYGQTTRYIYETAVNPDSINLVGLKTERTFLDIKGSQSLFISEHKLVRDSLVSNFKRDERISNKKEGKDFSKLGIGKSGEQSFFDYYILKDIPDQKVYYYDRVGGKQIYYQEDRPIQWNVTNDVEKQNGYSSQKATASFAGRTWTAWFTKDINVSDGPYKFSGLPGLIVKLEDDKGDYKFDLIKKVVVKNPFEEPMDSDARKTSRVNFHGDKAALELELSKNKRSINGGNNGGMQGFEAGRHQGGMNGGGRDGMNGGNSDLPAQSFGSGNTSFNTGSQNPIELQ